MAIDMQYTNPDLEQKWEYLDNQGDIQGEFPSIAIWAWNVQGLLPKNLMIRRIGSGKWITLIDALAEINEITRLQFTKLLFINKDWHYVGNDSNIHGPFDGNQMMVYAFGGYFNDDCQLLAVEKNQKIEPKIEMFKSYKTYLVELMQSQEMLLKNNDDEIGNIPDPPSSTNDQINFEELKKHAQMLFSNSSIDWYSAVENEVYGPYKNNDMISWIDVMPPNYMLCCVQGNSPKPNVESFQAYKDHLLSLQKLYPSS